ncbi:FG-GAP repeat domain-containing protein [Candidatus Chloroploca asiatica]|uniref:VCBS repeat-containing protein n=1 Tax=Candidatus Chloroploca asiatica TaxID=1506545 RepID=A0A2H3KJU3_9CHLR|nr:VCBS repeat-containing protein [Candidatus Chloroploca asiatica]PDV98221.1 hypothetical protein A9Q02_16400 [Candidatus Chloroploca asiatica]
MNRIVPTITESADELKILLKAEDDVKPAISNRCYRLLFLLPLLVLTGCIGFFERPPQVRQVALADLNGDGAQDIVVANGRFGEPYTFPSEIQYQILYNDGAGNFTASARLPVEMSFGALALGDVDGDQFIDAVFLPNPTIIVNDGAGTLAHPHAVEHEGWISGGVALADLNGNGRLDIFVANCCGGVSFPAAGAPVRLIPENMVFFNAGNGAFHDSGQRLGHAGSTAVALGDLNGDGSPDAFVANGLTFLQIHGDPVWETPNEVWFNDGDGMFTDSLQALGQRESWAVALGDVNGNGFLDAVVGNAGPDEIWINDGQGFFTLLGEVNNGPTRQVFLVDLDGDDVLDLVTAGNTRARVWRNDGQGQLREIRSRIRYSANDAVGVGDVDGDGLPDIVVADVRGCQVWFNQGDGRFQTRRDARCGR